MIVYYCLNTLYVLIFFLCTDTGLRFIFDNVDPNNHQRKFTFVVFINKQDLYERMLQKNINKKRKRKRKRKEITSREILINLIVVECKPKISDVQPMLDELNRENNMSRFVVQMRKKFQEKCIQ